MLFRSNLSKLQLEERSKITFKAENLESGYMVAPLIFPVFVENAFKHSLSSVSENIEISIDIFQKGDQLNFKCANSYSLETNTKDLAGGIGLENVRKRLELLYPKKHTLTIEKNKGEFIVFLALNLHRE